MNHFTTENQNEPPFRVRMAFVWRAGQEIEYFVNSMYRGFGRDIPTTELEQVHVVKALERFWNEDCKQQQQQEEDP